MILAVSMACWFRDWYSRPTDDHIADQQAQAARVAEYEERANQRAINYARRTLRASGS